MTWTVLFHDAFDEEFSALSDGLQDELLAHAKLLAEFGPNLGRPTVDTLKGSRHPNMKELRFSWKGQLWRVAFAFEGVERVDEEALEVGRERVMKARLAHWCAEWGAEAV